MSSSSMNRSSTLFTRECSDNPIREGRETFARNIEDLTPDERLSSSDDNNETSSAIDGETSYSSNEDDTDSAIDDSFERLSISDDLSNPRYNRNVYLQVDLPSYTPGVVPFAYERALRNRIRYAQIAPGSEYDAHAFPPTFLHDCIMLPGTLASLLNKVASGPKQRSSRNESTLHANEELLTTQGSPEDLLPLLTPALLPGYHPHIHPRTRQPCLRPSPAPGRCVEGILVFGQSKRTRMKIDEHYRPRAQRVKVEVETDLLFPVPLHERRDNNERWRLSRRVVCAHAWIWKDASMFMERGDGRGWSLEAYLAGDLGTGLDLDQTDDGSC